MFDSRLLRILLPLLLPIVGSFTPAGGLALASVAGAAAPEETLIDDSWQLQRMAGATVGYLHIWITKIAGEQTLFATSTEARMEIKRGKAHISIVQSSTTTEDENGRLVHIHSQMKMSAEESVTDVYFEGRQARIVTRVLGKERETPIELPEDVYGPYFLELVGREKGLEPGTEYDMKSFLAEMSSVATVHVKVVGREMTELLDGTSVELHRVETLIDVMPIPTSSWVDDDHHTYKTSMTMIGMPVETYQCDKETALRSLDNVGELSPDMFTSSLLAAKEIIPFPRSLDEALLKITPRDPSTRLPDLSDSRQSIVMNSEDGSIVLRIARKVPASGGTRPLRPVPEDLRPFLDANTMVQSDEEEILEVARSVVGDETSAWRAAQKLESWVDEHISQKSMDTAFATALEVCRNKKGDCSEHSVLLWALCRAAGIPSRSAMGLEYIAGIWGGHAWTEVWIDGDWYALDATLGYGQVDPMHLTFSTMSLKDGAFAREFTNLIQLLGSIEIEVLSATFNGRKFRPTREGAIDQTGDRCTHKLWSLAFTVPSGFEVETAQPAQAIRFDLLELEGEGKAGERSEIEIDAHDLPANFEWAQVLAPLVGANLEARPLDVDLRPARWVERKDHTTIVLINADPALFVFEFKRMDSKAIDDFLASLDFDVGLVAPTRGS